MWGVADVIALSLKHSSRRRFLHAWAFYTLDRSLRQTLAVPTNLGTFSNASGVNQHQLLTTGQRQLRVHRIPGRTAHVTDNRTLLAAYRVQEAALTCTRKGT